MVIRNPPVLGDELNGLLLAAGKRLRRTGDDVFQLAGQREAFGRAHGEHPVAAFAEGCHVFQFRVVRLAQRHIAQPVRPVLQVSLGPSVLQLVFARRLGHDPHGLQAAWPDDGKTVALLVRTDKQQTRQRWVVGHFAAQTDQRAAGRRLVDSQAGYGVWRHALVQIADGCRGTATTVE